MHDLLGRIHSAAPFLTTGVATGFLHEITGLQLDTGVPNESRLLISHYLREYNRLCEDSGLTGEMVAPYTVDFRPTIAAAGSASVY